ncbi:hypothetical protein SAMN05660860_03163 [Geoalkalibacter ferrihydriticus]|uniref:Lipoprotein n=1 Tax=Geoalkalibacter ferrihydriticus TaxID=392333 RepID=A0A1G9W4G8_9BACT|nr:hypothetical protein [Geoalkalibacter ferrihydriticus]SDM79081.1 hypothetical protein SAMN05660860_03163 [Geoalkalibacter ferrihydriticus]
MKKLILLMVAAMLVFSLSACATPKDQQERVPVKCPACGYEGLDFIYQP